MPGYTPSPQKPFLDHLSILYVENLSVDANSSRNLFTFGEKPHLVIAYLYGFLIVQDDPDAKVQLWKGGTETEFGAKQWLADIDGLSPSYIHENWRLGAHENWRLGALESGNLRCHVWDPTNDEYGWIFWFPKPIRTYKVTRIQYYATSIPSTVKYAAVFLDSYPYRSRYTPRVLPMG